MLLISLIGEQPIPILLATRALKPERTILCHTGTTRQVAVNLAAMIPNAELRLVEPYDIETCYQTLRDLCVSETIFNFTGGTKPMALAAFEAARAAAAGLVYLSSENRTSDLSFYSFTQDGISRRKTISLGAMFTIEDYLTAHGLYPLAQKGPQNAQEAGLRIWLEKQVDECGAFLQFDAFEVDFILRRGNQVAVLEAKMTQKNTRFGIDQLNTIAGRAYLGTYTGKILVVSTPLGGQLSRLAEARGVRVVLVKSVEDQRTGRLLPDEASKQRLLTALAEKLGPPNLTR